MGKAGKVTDKTPVNQKLVYTNEALWAGKTIENSQLVRVVWRDITAVSNWNDEEEVAPVRRFTSVGYFLYEGPDPKDPEEDMTVIATTWDGDMNRWRDYVCFPSTVVREIVPVIKPRKKK